MEKKPKKKQNQPKHHANKSKSACKLRRKKIIKALAEGKTNQQAGVEAGLSPKTAADQVSQIISEPKTRSEFQKLLDDAVPDSELATKYKALLESKKCISAMVVASSGEGMKDANSMTRDFVEVDDCAVQLKAADSISKLKGHLVEKPTNIVINIAEELEAARQRVKSRR